jgi:ATP-dependent exoDNAse (exonuclease V) beta subunit
VFIYGCMGQQSPSSEGETFFDFNTGLSVKPKNANRNFFYLQQKELINQMELAEYRRLIYVAVTRAVKDYYIVGDYSYSKDSITVEKNALLRNVTMSYYEDELLNGYPDIYFNEDAPFDLEIITPVEKQILYDFSFEARSIDELRHDKIQKIAPVMNDTPIVQIPVCEEKRISPSALENLVTIEEKSTNETNEFKYPEYNQINEIIDNTYDEITDSYEFGYNDFGTLVHAYMEYYVKNVPVEEIKLIVKNTVSNFLNLTQRQQEKLLDVCELMAKSFVANYSQINVVETEYAFKMFLDDYLITGSIDLLYKDKND